MLEDVGRCWKIGLKPGKINSLTRGSSTNESQVTSPSLIFHLANFANVSNYRNGTVLLERTLPCQMWLQMAVHLALVWASSGWFSTSCGRAQHQNSQNPQCSGQIEKYMFFWQTGMAKYNCVDTASSSQISTRHFHGNSLPICGFVARFVPSPEWCTQVEMRVLSTRYLCHRQQQVTRIYIHNQDQSCIYIYNLYNIYI